jgi:hypothetical protein
MRRDTMQPRPAGGTPFVARFDSTAVPFSFCKIWWSPIFICMASAWQHANLACRSLAWGSIEKHLALY